MSTFEAKKLGTAASASQAVSGPLGGLFGQAAQSAQSLGQIVAGPRHDTALRKAIEEIRPLFKQCSRRGNWVCEPVSWNKKAGLCDFCTPDMDKAIGAAQAQAAITPDNPHRLALRRLRAATRARLIYSPGWMDAMRKKLSTG